MNLSALDSFMGRRKVGRCTFLVGLSAFFIGITIWPLLPWSLGEVVLCVAIVSGAIVGALLSTYYFLSVVLVGTACAAIVFAQPPLNWITPAAIAPLALLLAARGQVWVRRLEDRQKHKIEDSLQ